MDAWRIKASEIPDANLRKQALSSIDHKRFHCQGGTVFAAWHPAAAGVIVRFIVAFQTISDYLDNLCDRTESLDGANFRTLHDSMLDAVSLDELPPRRYYARHPHSDDGGYMASLVAECREALAQMPGYHRVEPKVRRLVSLYIDLQVYKHIALSQRVPSLEKWFNHHQQLWPDANWWEFAAAAGSTLAVFALITEGTRSHPVEDAEELVHAYFPWICGLHILLDYLIDQEEDLKEQDLNFVSFYASPAETEERFAWILNEAQKAASRLKGCEFHYSVIEGLLGLYLTDPKVHSQGLAGLADTLVNSAGWRARLVRRACQIWRKSSKVRQRVPGGAAIEKERSI